MRSTLAVAAFVLLATPAAAEHWLPGNGLSCIRVCAEIGGRAIRSGQFVNGNAFTICRADVNGEGLRPGFNLQPQWSHACFVAHGGRELPVPRYDCLCER